MPDPQYDRMVECAALRFNAAGGALDLCDFAHAAALGFNTTTFERDVARAADALGDSE